MRTITIPDNLVELQYQNSGNIVMRQLSDGLKNTHFETADELKRKEPTNIDLNDKLNMSTHDNFEYNQKLSLMTPVTPMSRAKSTYLSDTFIQAREMMLLPKIQT